MTEQWVINFDGACEPTNPGGVATWGYVVHGPDDFYYESYAVIGEGEGMTNNIAEYTALLEAIKYGKTCLNNNDFILRGDSKLVINQVSGLWKLKSENLRELYTLCMDMLEALRDRGTKVELEWVPREQNEEADEQSKKAYLEYCEKKGREVRICPECNSSMVLRENKKNGYKFYGCSRYPKCKKTIKSIPVSSWEPVIKTDNHKKWPIERQLHSPISLAIERALADSKNKKGDELIGHDILPSCDYQMDKTYPYGAFIYCEKLGMESDMLPGESISCFHRIVFGQCPGKKSLKVEHECNCRICHMFKNKMADMKNDKKEVREAMDGSPCEVKGEYFNIIFQCGPIQENGINGTTIEEIIEVLWRRLEGFQKGDFRCDENALAITKLQEAQHWLQHRTRLRQEQGVEGKNEPHKS